MNFAASVAGVSAIYLVVYVLERLPALRFRSLPVRRPYLATDLAWYGAAIAMTAMSVFLLRPLLEGLQMATPRLHRRHHIPETSDKNFGAMFTIWDRLFESFTAVDTGPDERFGCPGEVDTYPQRFAQSVRQPPRDIRALRRGRRHAERIGERTPVS